MEREDTKKRYNFIDAIRGAAVISMVIYHLCYDIFQIYKVDVTFIRQPPVIAWEHSICMSFILVAGISLNFSRRAWRRGVIVNLCGVAVTVVTLLVMPSEQIWFGVLNLIGCAILITQALRGLLDRIRPVAGMIGFGLFFVLTKGVPNGYLGIGGMRLLELPGVLYRCKYLFFLGFPSAGFHSADYFPLVPWLFLFLFGYLLWRFLRERGWDGVFRFEVPFLSLIGRHSLLLYLVHQPVLYALCAAVFGHW